MGIQAWGLRLGLKALREGTRGFSHRSCTQVFVFGEGSLNTAHQTLNPEFQTLNPEP